MAEINTNRGKNNQKKIFTKKRIHVDLTPMVDLGFLLITFFVFTTTMTKATAMDMLVPNDTDSTAASEVCESCALTVLLGKNDRLYYYEGKDETAVYKETNYSANGIRDIIMQKKKTLFEKNPKLTLQLIIKPSVRSDFKNLVDIIDEANICALKRYYITELNDKDIAKAE